MGGGGGSVINLISFPAYETSSPFALSLLYLLLLFYMFLGVAMAADVFMAAIEQITSSLKYVKHKSKDGSIKRFRIRTWNPTVANLTLMALGSSAPEILLAAIELISNNMFSGDLGPSTIVGSAAFNLFVIIAVCVIAIPATQKRKIAQPRVYSITAFFSVFAYVWLVLVLKLSSPDLITVTEAVLTLLLFPLLVYLAFIADKWADPKFRSKWKARFGMVDKEAAVRSELLPSELLLDVKNADGTPLDGAELIGMIKRLRRTATGLAMNEEKAVAQVYQQMAAQQPKSRAYYRVNATRMMTGQKEVDNHAPALPEPSSTPTPKKAGKKGFTNKVAPSWNEEEHEEIQPGHSVFEFSSESYAIIEAAGTVTVQVVRAGDAADEAAVSYTTVDGTAVSSPEDKRDYEAMSGTLTFKPGQQTCDITIKIFDDDEIEPDEQFSIELKSVESGDASIGKISKSTITIINDDFPGTLALPLEEMEVKESCGTCKVIVDRVQGCSGHITMDYCTKNGTALAGKNYEKSEGKLEWSHQDVEPKAIEVVINDDDVMSGNLYFEVEISNATGGAVFDEKTDGSSERSLCRVTILDDDTVRSIADRAIGMLGMSQQTVKLSAGSCGEQFRNVFKIGGGDDDDEDDDPDAPPKKHGVFDWIMHILSIPFKLICALIPPASIAGGYPCFVIAIIVIGIMTAVIGDLAGALGCAMGIKNEVVAITFVALGTSLPDAFASKSAAQGDPTADAAVGNVTGSNAVNVFLGLGISWTIGAIYWAGLGVTVEWLYRYCEKPFGSSVTMLNGAMGCSIRGARVNVGDNMGLAVPAGSLAFGVIVFCVCACVCIGTLAARRHFFDAELGSKMRWPTFTLLVGLWLLYVTLSTLVSYEFIPAI